MPHRAVVRLVINSQFAQLDESRVLAQLAPASFDAATFEIWGALLNGATLVLPQGNGLPELSKLDDILKSTGVTTLWLTAALFNMIIDEKPELLSSVKEVLTGGEALSVPHICRALAALPNTTFINGYGPTENTTFTCCYRIPSSFDESAASVPIGRPISNTKVYIVDDQNELVPVGIPGELLVGGDGLALGYWQRDELNTLAFIPDELSGAADGSNARLYRTGDICRYLPDGNIEFFGRHDDQIKIRGFRIEPGEVEAALLDLDGIQKAAVVYEPIGDSGRLVAFVTPMGDSETPMRLARGLRDRLPRHLIPSRIMTLSQLPVSQNGKVDRQALLQISAEKPEIVEIATPETKTETQLVAIWSEILQNSEVGVTETFFSLGGHSLMAVRLFDHIRRNFGPDLPISTLFSHSTIRDLAEVIDWETKSSGTTPASLEPDAEWDTSIVIHPGPGKDTRALFIVGGAGGNVNNLVDLGAEIGSHRPVIGFQMRGILGHKPRETMEELAAENIRYMRRHQANGLYLLAGYSAGAQTAFEMARQLVADGETVTELFLIDTWAPDFAQLSEFTIPVKLSRRQKFQNEMRLIRDYGSKHLFTRVRAKLTRKLLRGKVLDWMTSFDLSLVRRIRTEKAWFAAALTYKGGPYPGRASLVLSQPDDMREEILISEHPLLGWDKHIERKLITRYIIKGRHLEMVLGDHAKTLAKFIEERINAADPSL